MGRLSDTLPDRAVVKVLVAMTVMIDLEEKQVVGVPAVVRGQVQLSLCWLKRLEEPFP